MAAPAPRSSVRREYDACDDGREAIVLFACAPDDFSYFRSVERFYGSAKCESHQLFGHRLNENSRAFQYTLLKVIDIVYIGSIGQ